MSDNPLHSVSVSGATFDDEGRVLLIKRRDNGEWQTPGGVLELGEAPENGVVREVLEETGITVVVDHLTGVYTNIPRHVIALVYRCHVLSGEATPTDESQEVAWVKVPKALSLMTPAFAVRVEDAQELNPGAAASRAHDGVDLVELL